MRSSRSRLLLGALLVAVAWPLTWLLPGSRSHILFFPLWLGYILVVDGLVALRSDTSILNRSPRAFGSLFLASIPIWWLFELVNRRVASWEYVGSAVFSDAEYVFWASLCFSTVVPAVFETAELVSTFRSPERPSGRGRTVSAGLRWSLVAAGLALAAALLYQPQVLYPFLWLFPILVFDPIAYACRRPSILAHVEDGRLAPIFSLALGAIICGFFWELWNFYAYPKWIYHVPGLDFARLFEMPALGYLGYLPFGVSLYSMTHLLVGRMPGITPARDRGAAGSE